MENEKNLQDDWKIIGHRWAVQRLQSAIANAHFSHAYLFTGPPGIGKMTLAQAMTSALLCSGEEEKRPCGRCRACQLNAGEAHPDLHVVKSGQPGDSLKIDQIRELQHQLALTPVEGNRRVAILNRFEEATTSAANALLKTLEEPPAYVVLIVLASDPDQLLPTIFSRCQHVPLRPLPIALVKQALSERWRASTEDAEVLAHLSNGRLGWAVRMFKDEKALQRRERRLEDLDQLLAASTTERFQYASKLARDPVATYETLELWLSWWRDVMLRGADANSSLTNVDRYETIQRHAQHFDVEEANAVLKSLRKTIDRLDRNANSRLALEVLMLDLPRV